MRPPNTVNIQPIRSASRAAGVLATNAARLTSPTGVDHRRLVGHHLHEGGTRAVPEGPELGGFEAVFVAAWDGDAEVLQAVFVAGNRNTLISGRVDVMRRVVGPRHQVRVGKNPKPCRMVKRFAWQHTTNSPPVPARAASVGEYTNRPTMNASAMLGARLVGLVVCLCVKPVLSCLLDVLGQLGPLFLALKPHCATPPEVCSPPAGANLPTDSLSACSLSRCPAYPVSSLLVADPCQTRSSGRRSSAHTS